MPCFPQPGLTYSHLLVAAGRSAGLAIDSLMAFFMLANALDAEPFSEPGEVIGEPRRNRSPPTLSARLRIRLSAPGSLERNPIRTWQLLADSDNVAYCPFAYGYSNYSRPGYAPSILRTGGLVTFNGQPLCSTLGGAGLAISRTMPAS